jgi:integrase
MSHIQKRRTKSGEVRYDVKYRDPAGRERSVTKRTRKEAEAFRAGIAGSLGDGTWVDPAAGKITVHDYVLETLADRQLRPRTRETYGDQFRLHIDPDLGDIPLAKLTPMMVRHWHAGLTRKGLSANTAAKVYRLLRSILNTSVDDGVLARNPCTIKGAGVERADERGIATVEQVWAAADAMPERMRVIVLIAGFVGLRVGEILGLERRHIDSLHRTIAVEQQEQQLTDGTLITGPPKTDAGKRVIAVPPPVFAELETHLTRFAGPGPRGRVFPGEKGGTLRRLVLHKHWTAARDAAGLPDNFVFHDLRHTAHTLAAQNGATTRELMYRMGQSSTAAAMRYQHATRQRDAQIAATLGDAITRPEPQSSERTG